MKTFALCTSLALSLFACGGESRQAPEPKLSSANAETPRAVGWPTLGAGEARFIRIDLGPDALIECQKISPKFPFDSASTLAQDREQVIALASCLNAPGMRERRILLVGRADSTGKDAYNDELGRKRATAIKQILIDSGIPEGRIEVATEGAKGALGDKLPEYSQGYDRRVDILVMSGTHTP